MCRLFVAVGIALLASLPCRGDEKPLFVVASNRVEGMRQNWNEALKRGARIQAVLRNGESVFVSHENMEQVLGDLSGIDADVRAMIGDLQAAGHDAMSRGDYNREKPDRKVVAVTINEFAASIPGAGIVFFADKFVPYWDNSSQLELHNSAGIRWSDSMRAVDDTTSPEGGLVMKRFFDGPGTEEFRVELGKLLADQKKLAEMQTARLWNEAE